MRNINKQIGLSVIFLLFLVGAVSAQIPSTKPCWVKGTITGSGIDVEGLTVGAYDGSTLLKSGTIGAGGSYSLNSVGANDGDTISLKVYGHAFKTFTFAGYCKTGDDDPWAIQNFTVSKQANGQTCDNNAICTSGYCSSGVCAATPSTSSGSSGRSSSGESLQTFYPTDYELERTYTNELYKDWKIQFSVSNQAHTLNVDSVTSTSATITISSAPQTKTLFIGEEWSVDITGDGFYDVSVTLNSISGNAVSLTIKSLVKSAEPVDVPKEKTPEPDKKTDVPITPKEKSLLWLWILIVILIIIILLILFSKNKKFSRKSRKRNLRKFRI